MGILDRVRAACAEVSERARYVHFHPRRLPAYLSVVEAAGLGVPVYDTRHHFQGEAEATCAYILTLDTINFGSGYFPHLRKRAGMSGYFTVASRLKDAWEARGPLGAADLRDVSLEGVAALFGQDLSDEATLELMGLFAAALQGLGDFLLERWDGIFSAPVAAAAGSAERLVETLVEMPFFQDASDYFGLEVPLLKRAQITASDLALAFGGQGYGRFDDLERLTIFADNLVPHVLRQDGLLSYEDELAARIEAGEPIAAGSPEEVEIRAVALHAVEELTEHMRQSGRACSARELDVFLWNRGQDPAYKSAKRHRTRTVFY